jgi:hypothetical protein
MVDAAMNSPSENWTRKSMSVPTQFLPELIRDIQGNILRSVNVGKIKAECIRVGRWLHKEIVEMFFWSASDQES